VADTVMAWLAVIVQASLLPWLPAPSEAQPELSMAQKVLPLVMESRALVELELPVRVPQS